MFNKRRAPKTIYIIARGYKPRPQDSWCYSTEIFYSKKQARKYCTQHNEPKCLIRKVTVRDE